ncbi:hypothetical protein FRX31_023525 [Thalictrum thalictroides]|uniref:Plant bHLH transcription factor ACT-like domain-containing protein n=1 Tax=Thalictrum thalictroides TaxID=46969 RepID=A0A7J6VP46_THATH|nr:hypothetical protein FRX31_023525 [Thalictrum thalictroides]
MVSTVERQKVLNKKLQEKKSDILMDALTYIKELKQKVDDMTKECGDSINKVDPSPTMDVKVEKLENNRYAVTVTCEKVQDMLVSLLEAFEEECLDVLHADINCNQIFHFEGIVEDDDGTFDVEMVTDLILEVLENKGVKKDTRV